MATRKVNTAAEQDAISPAARRVLCYLGRPGVTSGIKRQIRRRERQDAKRQTGRDPR